MTPSQEEFQAWQADPVTAWVMAAMGSYAGKLRDVWIEHTWTAGNHPDSSMLTDLRARADAHLALSELSYERMVELDGTDPEPR